MKVQSRKEESKAGVQACLKPLTVLVLPSKETEQAKPLTKLPKPQWMGYSAYVGCRKHSMELALWSVEQSRRKIYIQNRNV